MTRFLTGALALLSLTTSCTATGTPEEPVLAPDDAGLIQEDAAAPAGESCAGADDCPEGRKCCVPNPGSSTKGTCQAPGAGAQCMCRFANECPSGACGGADGRPTVLRLCVPNDGAAYHGCNGGVTCGTGFCCSKMTGTGGLVCQRPCRYDSECGVGASCHLILDGSCDGAVGVCTGDLP